MQGAIARIMSDTNENNATTPPTHATLYERETALFGEMLRKGSERALDRYGLTYFYSLPPEDHFLQRQQLGYKPELAIDHYNLGLAHACKGDMGQAVACWKQALKGDPDLAEAHFNLGLAAQQAGDNKTARTHLAKFLELEPHDEDAQETERILQEIG